MPPLPLTNLLHTALPERSATSRAVLSTLGCLNGLAPRAGELATWVGLRNRHHLARVLQRDGLPRPEELGGWTHVLYWLSESDASGASLHELAAREQLDPAVAYRLVRRLTGRRWSEIRREGVTLAMLRLRDRCRAPQPAEGETRAARTVPAASRRPARLPEPPPDGWGARAIAPDGPFDVAVAGRVALVTRLRAAAVDVIDLATASHVATIPVGAAPTRIVVHPSARWAYVTSQFAEAIDIIDLAALRRVGAIQIAGHPLGAAIAPDGRSLYVTTNLDRLCTVSLPKRRVTSSVAIPLVCPQIAVHPAGHRVYVPCWRAGVILEIDAHQLRETRRFAVRGVAQDVLVSRDERLLYAANEGGWVDAIHLATGEVIASIPLGGAALGLAASPEQEFLYVSLVHTGRVVVLDPRRLAVRRIVATGGKPRLMTVDPAGRTTLVANERGWVDFLR